MENNTTGLDGSAGSPIGTTDTGALGTTESRGLKDQAVRGAQQLMDRAQSQVRTRVDEGKSTAARTLSNLASTLQQSSSQLLDKQEGLAGEYISRAADQLDRASRYVESAELDEIVDGVERFARRQPAVFIGAAFAVGILGARFLKSSRKQTSQVTRYGSAFADREVSTALTVESGGAGSAGLDYMSARPVGGGNTGGAGGGLP
jgi:hypothetical protein